MAPCYMGSMQGIQLVLGSAALMLGQGYWWEKENPKICKREEQMRLELCLVWLFCFVF